MLKYDDCYLWSSELQFGLKQKTGCSDALGAFSNVVDYYTQNGSTVSVAALDTSKAFNKVNHFGLFIKLLKRKIPVKFYQGINQLVQKSCFMC